jgi:long-chain fatty acid transport protein
MLVGLIAVLVAGSAEAGGVILYEVGTPDVGYASAGWAARADGPVTILTNPAGMTRLDDTQVEVGLQGLYGYLQFAPTAPPTTVTGNNGGNAVGVFPGGGVYASFAPFKDFRVGLGVFSNFGLSEKWDSGWVGRYYSTQSTLIGLTVMPGVAWNVIGGLSVGATFNAMYGYLKQTVALNNLEPSAGDGSLEVSSSTWGFGADVGLLYEFTKGSRLGVTYTSPMRLNFSSTPTVTGLGPGLKALIQAAGIDTTASIDLGMTVPQTVMVSYFQAIGDKWAVMGDVGWQNWATFGTVEVQLTTNPPKGLTTSIGYLNTWHGALGAQVQLAEPWLLTFGVAYDSTMTNDTNRSLPLAIGAAWRFGLGARWAVNPNWDLGFAYEFLWGGSPSVSVDRGPLAGAVGGSYANTSFQFFVFNFTWKS